MSLDMSYQSQENLYPEQLTIIDNTRFTFREVDLL